MSLEYFQVRFGDITTFDRSYDWEDICQRQGEAPRERSREEHKKGNKGNQGNKGGAKRKMADSPKENEATIQSPDAGESFGKFVWSTCITT